jgi:hypothetical protein
MKIRHWICCTLTLLVLAPVSAGETETTYFAVLMDGKKMGYSTETRKVTVGKVTHVETLELTVARGEITMTVRQAETTIETPDGRPLGFESVQELGAMATRAQGTVASDGTVEVTVTAMNQQSKQTFKWPAGAVMNEGLRLLTRKNGLKEGTSYTASVFVPSMLQALQSKMTVGPSRKVDLLGRVVRLTEMTTNMQSPAGTIVATEYVDKDFEVQKVIMPVMGMSLEMVACDKSFALSDNELVDFLDKLLLQSPAPLGDLKAAKSATYILEPVGKKTVEGVPATDNQTVRNIKNGALSVTVRPLKARKGVRFPYKGNDPTALEALKPNRYVQSEHKAVIDLARKAVGETTDTALAVKKIETFVGNYISEKNLSVGYATAADVIASKEGDCSEHAVLAAAMCRALGIPARVAVGLAYIRELGVRKDVFGGHAWVEVFIGGKWIGVDATRGGVGVGHITQAFGNGEPADFFALINTMGYFKITRATVKR